MKNQINAALVAAFSPLVCRVENESHMHSRGDQTHFKVVIVSDMFDGLSPVKRHQKIYAALGGIMQQIHALAIQAYSPNEWEQGEMSLVHDSPLCSGGSKRDFSN